MDDDDGDPTIRITGAPKPRLVLEVDSKQMPILPSWNKLRDGSEDFTSQKEIIRAFVIEHYSTLHSPSSECCHGFPVELACNRETVRVPWGSIQAKQNDFLEPDSICGDALLVDPSRIQHDNATRILTHWRTFGFKFRNYSKGGTLQTALYKNLEKGKSKQKQIGYVEEEDSDADEPRPTKGKAKKQNGRAATQAQKKGKGRATSAPTSETENTGDASASGEELSGPLPAKKKRKADVAADKPAPKKIKIAAATQRSEVVPISLKPQADKVQDIAPPVRKKATANKSRSLKILPPTLPRKAVKFAQPSEDAADDEEQVSFESISNPQPKSPAGRAETRSMTGASPVKAPGTTVPRPKPKPVGKSGGKVPTKDLEASMKQTSTRTLKLVEGKAPAKPRRK